MKQLYPRILRVIVFLALTLSLSSIQVKLETINRPDHSTISSISNDAQTTGLLGWSEAQAKKPKDYCKDHCRHEYKERLRECKERGHEHRKDCKRWAKERERECLENCYREHPRHMD